MIPETARNGLISALQYLRSRVPTAHSQMAVAKQRRGKSCLQSCQTTSPSFMNQHERFEAKYGSSKSLLRSSSVDLFILFLLFHTVAV